MPTEQDWRHAKSYPTEPPPPGCSWVWCWKSETGPERRPGWRWEATDVPISDLVAQLNRSIAGEPPLVPTAGCCAGHKAGELPHVLLDDGRVLVVLPSQEHIDLIQEALRSEPKGPVR